MSISLPGTGDALRPLRVRGVEDDARAKRRVAAAIGDLSRGDGEGIDDRTRAALLQCLRNTVASVEIILRQHCARQLSSGRLARLSPGIASSDATTCSRLMAAGLLDDTEMMGELLARVRLHLLGQHLPVAAAEGETRAGLLVALSTHADGIIARNAMAVMVAFSRRDGTLGNDIAASTDLPAELHHRLVWWVAAALGEEYGFAAEDDIELLERALTDAALRSLGAHDEGDRLEVATMQLARAIDPNPQELVALMVDAFDDRHPEFACALVAHALGMDFDLAREIMLDPVADRLWLALRALDFKRPAIARIGLALCEADAGRDVEAFADRMETIVAVSVEEARQALAPLRRQPDFRQAALALARRPDA